MYDSKKMININFEKKIFFTNKEFLSIHNILTRRKNIDERLFS
jgi:hypothetical protein